MKVPFSHKIYKIQDHTYEQQNSYKFKEDNPYRESIRINWVFESIKFVWHNIIRVWFKERFTTNKIRTKAHTGQVSFRK